MERTIDSDKYKNKILTIPNVLSFVRLCLIPVISYLYLSKSFLASGIVVLISGATDVVDGFIARTFNMISDLGKVLDPIADKATQGVVMLLLATRFHLMLIPIAALIIKESFMAISGYMVIKKAGVVLGANWHGKAATILLTATMTLHIFWYDLPSSLSAITIIISAVMILISLLLYAIRNLKYLK